MPTFTGDDGDNTLTGAVTDDLIYGLGGNDTLNGGDGNDILDGGSGDDTIDGGDGVDTITYADSTGYVIVDLGQSLSNTVGAGWDTITNVEDLVGSSFDDLLLGSAGANRISGGAGNDQIFGGGGADTLIGGDGMDSLNGGDGNDVFLVDFGSDRVIEAAGGGFDVVYILHGFGLEAGSEVEVLRMADPSHAAYHVILGNEFGQILIGADGAGRLEGRGGDDYLEGRGGDDEINGGSGDDRMLGGAGNDYFYADSTADRAIEAQGEGHDIVLTSQSFAIEVGSEIEELRVENGSTTNNPLDLTGNEFAQTLSGNNGANRLLGLGGDDHLEGRGGVDTLDGGTGADVLRGGTGDDFYFADNSGDRMLEAAGEGLDTVFASASVSIEAGSEVEALRAADAASMAALNLSGNEYNQVIAGNAGANKLSGKGGDDYLEGRAGSDTLDGGTGIDTLIGGTGDDYYLVDDKLDRVIENVGEGFDTIFSSSSTYRLDAGLSIEAIRADETPGSALILAGNELGQILAGNNGDNRIFGFGGDDYLEGRGGVDTLDGGTGGDTMRGGTGDDYYIVDSTGDRILESAGEGFDAAFVDASFALEAGSEVEELRAGNASSTARMDLFGNEFGQVIQGNEGVNLIVGGGGDDYLEARGGDDRLEGGSGNDVLIGGTGVDIFAIGEIGHTDRIIDFVSGTDRVDLRGIDADSSTVADDPFAWIGENAFTNVAGQLRTYSSEGVHYLAGDVDGNGTADFLIDLGSTRVVTGDLLF